MSVATDQGAVPVAASAHLRVKGTPPLLGFPREGRPPGFVPPESLSATDDRARAPEVATGAPAPRVATDAVTALSGLGDEGPRAHDFRTSLPLPDSTRLLVEALTECSPLVSVRLSAAAGRKVVARCLSVGRAPVGGLDDGASQWLALDCGLGQPGAVILGDAMVLALADLFLGGSGVPDRRTPDELDQRLVLRHLPSALAALEEPLAPHGGGRVQVSAAPEEVTVTAALGGAEVLAVQWEVDVDGRTLPGVITAALPARPLIGTGADDEPSAPRADTAGALGGVPVTMTVRFHPPTVASALDVRDLEPGDVLRLDGAHPMVLGVVDSTHGELPVVTGSLGRRGQRRAVVVDLVMDPAREQA